jgi:hypothetical protein
MKFGIIVLAIIVLPVIVYSQSNSNGYIGLFIDDAHSSWCVTFSGEFQALEVWVWCLPGVNGVICANFDLHYPSNIIVSTSYINEDIFSPSLSNTECLPGYCYKECQYDWHWIYRTVFYITDYEPSYIEIIDHPVCGYYHLNNCEEGHPEETCKILTNLYINSCEPYAVQESSWGVIKSLFRLNY